MQIEIRLDIGFCIARLFDYFEILMNLDLKKYEKSVEHVARG
jgi:hypothetical protein